VLNDRRIGGGGRHEPQADDEYEAEVDHKKGEDDAPAWGEPQPLELEEDKPKDRTGDDEDKDCYNYEAGSRSVVPQASRLPSRRRHFSAQAYEHFGRFAAPLFRQIAQVDHLRRLEGPDQSLHPGTTTTKPIQPIRLTASASG